jgi:hypothetical protein
MRFLTVLKLTAAALICFGISHGSANERSTAPSIKLWPDAGGIDSMMPYMPTIRAATQDTLTGTVAHVIAYVEQQDGRGHVAFDPNAKQMFIFPTTKGRFVVRFLDLPTGHGWYGPF